MVISFSRLTFNGPIEAGALHPTKLDRRLFPELAFDTAGSVAVGDGALMSKQEFVDGEDELDAMVDGI